jgi:hypothetical protein
MRRSRRASPLVEAGVSSFPSQRFRRFRPNVGRESRIVLLCWGTFVYYDGMPTTATTTTIFAEDGVELGVGDRAFNYYDRKSGAIEGPVYSDGWFEFRHDDGSRTSLNGERICSIGFAQRKGWTS